jgi:hypothetical protein
MTTINSYLFNNSGNISFDNTDVSQKNIYNTRFCNYTLSNYFSESASDDHVKFATQQPVMMFSGTAKGDGLNGTVVDVDSNLLIKTVQARPLEKLSLMERPFVTVPYLGRGSCDPVLESMIQQGEMVHDKKSVSTIMDKSFDPYSLHLLDDHMKKHVSNYAVEDKVLNGWNIPTRLNEDEYMKKANRPNINV